MQDKWVKLKDVEELVSLIKKREGFYDWSDEYEKIDKEVEEKIKQLYSSAKR